MCESLCVSRKGVFVFFQPTLFSLFLFHHCSDAAQQQTCPRSNTSTWKMVCLSDATQPAHEQWQCCIVPCVCPCLPSFSHTHTHTHNDAHTHTHTHSRIQCLEKGVSENEAPGPVGAYTTTHNDTTTLMPNLIHRISFTELKF